MAHFFKAVKSTIKHWYLPLIGGIILIIMGIWTFKEPAGSYAALAFLFSLSFIVSGLFETFFSISNREVIDNWGWQLVMGMITLIVGILMFLRPEISMLTLAFFVGFIVLFRSVNAIGVSLDLKNYGVKGWGTTMFLGILGIIFAIIMIWNPGLAGLSIVIWTAMALIIVGILSILVSLKLKKIHDIPDTISSDLRAKYNEIQDKIQEELSKNNN